MTPLPTPADNPARATTSAPQISRSQAAGRAFEHHQETRTVGFLARLTSALGRTKPYTSIGVTQAKDLLATGATVIDVRTTAEWRTGHIPAAKHLPLDRLQTSTTGLRKDRPVIAVCQSGTRSAAAARALAARGYDAYSLTGGMGAWRRAGEPTR